MIGVMEDIAEYSMSYFDTAKNKGKHAPENFYHGLVLGLIVSMRKEYRIVSNRESGDVMTLQSILSTKQKMPISLNLKF